MENVNVEFGAGAVELSMDDLALINGGGLWDTIKSVVSWGVNHADDVKNVFTTAKKVYDTIRSWF